MTAKQLHVLAISSFAVHGSASLKTFITFLGNKILPVPSVMLNGLTNMSLVRKFEMPFKELLQSTLELALNRDLQLIVYIGYLGKGEQAGVLLKLLDTYSGIIKAIITDPVCGDHGRIYVPDDVITEWPAIIRRSDIVFPNTTELKILTGHKLSDDSSPEGCAEEFRQLFPNTGLVVTSIKKNDHIGIHYFGNEAYLYQHAVLPKNYGGSGDTFLALYILNHYYRHFSFKDALTLAADQTYQIIENSIESNSADLLLIIPNKFLIT